MLNIKRSMESMKSTEIVRRTKVAKLYGFDGAEKAILSFIHT